MRIRIEIREDDTGTVIALYNKRWYGGSDIIFVEAIRAITEGMVPRFKAFQKALSKMPQDPSKAVDLDVTSPTDGKGKIAFER